MDISFLREYALNIDTAAFPVVTENRRNKKTIEREIVLLGDSHGWGQGSPDYDGRSWFSPHMALPYNKGFFARAQEYMKRKLDLYPPAAMPLRLAQFRFVAGSGYMAEADASDDAAAHGFYTPSAAAFARLGYLATEQKWDSSVCVIQPERTDEGMRAEWRFEMEGHARAMYIGIVAAPNGGRLDIRLEAPPYYTMPPGYPKVYRIVDGAHCDVPATEAAIADQSTVTIDTYAPLGGTDVVYCIDYGQKQQGTVSFRYAGVHANASAWTIGGTRVEPPALLLRGVLFDCNHIRNFAMGGHTVGQWLGDGTKSFHDDSYPHLDEVLTLLPFTPTLAIIQLPAVNEYLAQTPVPQLLANLDAVVGKLNGHRNRSGDRKMDVLLFTTVADKRVQFQNSGSAAIAYGDYFQAAKQFCIDRRYGFIDFQLFFEHAVTRSGLDYELLYDDATHPSPFVNETIAAALTFVLDVLW